MVTRRTTRTTKGRCDECGSQITRKYARNFCCHKCCKTHNNRNTNKRHSKKKNRSRKSDSIFVNLFRNLRDIFLGRDDPIQAVAIESKNQVV